MKEKLSRLEMRTFRVGSVDMPDRSIFGVNPERVQVPATDSLDLSPLHIVALPHIHLNFFLVLFPTSTNCPFSGPSKLLLLVRSLIV
jgi:hypothetical protein